MGDFTFEVSTLDAGDFTGVVVELTGDDTGATMSVMHSEQFTPEQVQGLLQLASDSMIVNGQMYTGEKED